MNVSVFVREMNATEYVALGTREFQTLPRVDEYISDDDKKYFQVLAVHHNGTDKAVELYAVAADPVWKVRKGRAIGFAHP